METPQNDIVILTEASGSVQAEMLRGLLEAQGIAVMLSEESAARTYGISLPGLGLVQIFVRADQAEAARKTLEDFEKGALEDEVYDDTAADDEEPES